MSPKSIALVGSVVSILALGLAFAQIVPAERSRLNTTITPNLPVTPAPAATPAPAQPNPSAATVDPFKPNGPSSGKPLNIPKVGGQMLVDDLMSLDVRIRRTRDRLIAAAKSGNLDKLLTVFQMNETKPIFSRGKETDPVAFWKQASGDGNGHEILAILINILELPAVTINIGTAQEMVVWPYLAHEQLDKLTPEQSVDLYRLMTAQDLRDMKALGKWVFWRVGIGKDGTLHYFVAGE